MSLDSIVNLQITVQSKAPSRAGFGTPLILGHHTANISDFVREYSTADEMLDDGFTTAHYLYQVAQIVKSQNPSPKKFKIGRRAAALTQTIHIIPTNTTVGFIYRGTIKGQTFSYTVVAEDTVALICAALHAAINALTGITSANDTTHVTVTPVAGDITDFDLGLGMNILDATPDTTTAAALAAIKAEDDDWYGLIVADSSSKATAAAVATFIEANRKISLIQSADHETANAGVSDDAFGALVTSARARTGGIYHRKIGGTEWLAAGLMAQRLTAVPGSDTWAFKTVASVSADVLSGAQKTALQDKNATHYTRVGGINITYQGKTGAGEYFDTVRFIDWLYARIQERVLFVLANNPKIPYTDAGVDLMRAAILAVLNQGVTAGGLSNNPAPAVTAPAVADVDPVDRINRLLPDVEFTAQLAGAIHGLEIRGTIAV
jgi:hypothetical protein